MLARSNGPARQGTALLVTMGLVMVTSLMLAAMITLSAGRNRSAFAADSRLARNYAADAGLERAKLEVAADKTWLATNAPTAHGNATFTGGAQSFIINAYQVTVRVYTMTDPAWYRVESTAISTSPSLKGPSTTLGMTFKNAATITTTSTSTTTTVSYTLFSDYARFVSALDLSVGANASYLGKVHTNGNLGINGNNITFYDNATCHGNITYQDSTARNTCTFKKSATPGVPSLDFPESDMLEDIAMSAPQGAIKYDWNDAAFKAAFQAATGGYTPASDMAVAITFNKDKMNVVSTSKCGGSTTRTFTQSNIAIPHDGAIFSRGKVTVSGNISRRLSVVTPANLYIDGPVRYVDDSGGAQWQLRKKTDNSLAAFNTGTNSWSPTADWNTTYNYVEASDWSARAPLINGERVNPALGLVAGSKMYVTGTAANREIMAALFTSGDGTAARDSADSDSSKGVIAPLVSGKTNLYIHGAIITRGTNPLSGNFSYRIYAYDPHLTGKPPPGFPGGDTIVTTTPYTVTTTTQNPAVFANWHVVAEEKQ